MAAPAQGRSQEGAPPSGGGSGLPLRGGLDSFRAPAWLPGGHAQTIWPAIVSKRVHGAAPQYLRERWDTPDGDFIDVDVQPALQADAPWLVMFHGLEGSSSSHYARGFAREAQDAGWHFAVPHFRGCSGELNRAPRAYHSGDFEEVGWILERLRARSATPLFVAGVSLGGNALLRWSEEAGETAARTAQAVAAVCSPIDLAAGGHAIGRGFNRQIYTRMFLRSMKPRALAKWAQHPGLFDRERLVAARDLYDFDNVFTAPVHGFKNTDDYWARASAKPHLHAIRIPALVLNARNDPFVPFDSLPQAREVGAHVTLWQPPHGGHVGFPGGRWPGHVQAMPQAVLSWMRSSKLP
jgi:predicted alpha/beta-fold hydrolase